MHRQLKVHSFEPLTRANGPGQRACLWLQGCTLACAGCFNPETHSSQAGELHSTEEIFGWIVECTDIEGITVSGGEPLQQPDALVELLESVRNKTNLSVLLFTGFSFDELERCGLLSRLRSVVDVLIAGRFVADDASKSGLIGSSNKTIHFFSERYCESDLLDVPVAEVIISPDGEVLSSGIDPLVLR